MKNYWFQKSLKFVAVAVFAVSPLTVSAHGMHKHKPLSLEELPEICRQYFARADVCYKKAGKKADFQRNNTKFLFQALPAADLGQRHRMCQIAMDSFKEKTSNLHCE